MIDFDPTPYLRLGGFHSSFSGPKITMLLSNCSPSHLGARDSMSKMEIEEEMPEASKKLSEQFTPEQIHQNPTGFYIMGVMRHPYW